MVIAISVKHNMEVAHRLWKTPGKCANVHGHSMWVTLTMAGILDSTEKLAGLDYGSIKDKFRRYLDTEYDHRLVLNRSDLLTKLKSLAGIKSIDGDPTTENLARIIGEWAMSTWPTMTSWMVQVDETAVNSATWSENA